MDQLIKCKKCRQSIISNLEIVSEHGDNQVCSGATEGKQSIYILENKYPEWVLKTIEQQNWTKGKLLCPNCNSKIGVFDFVESVKCSCNSNFVPAVSLTRSKIDVPLKL